MKYLKFFENHSDYETYIDGQDAILPNVSYCEDQNDVHYNPIVPPQPIAPVGKVQVFANPECTAYADGQSDTVYVRVNQDFGYGDNTEWGDPYLNYQEHLWISTPDNNDPGRYYGALVWADWNDRDSRTTPLVNGDVIECICGEFYPIDNPKVIFE